MKSEKEYYQQYVSQKNKQYNDYLFYCIVPGCTHTKGFRQVVRTGSNRSHAGSHLRRVHLIDYNKEQIREVRPTIENKGDTKRRGEPRGDEEDGQGGDGEDAVRGEDGESAKKRRKTLHEHLEQLVATMNEGLNQFRDQLHALDDLNQLRD